MGGANEQRLPGPDNLRINESGGDVHVHDDVRGTKLILPVLGHLAGEAAKGR